MSRRLTHLGQTGKARPEGEACIESAPAERYFISQAEVGGGVPGGGGGTGLDGGLDGAPQADLERYSTKCAMT